MVNYVDFLYPSYIPDWVLKNPPNANDTEPKNKAGRTVYSPLPMDQERDSLAWQHLANSHSTAATCTENTAVLLPTDKSPGESLDFHPCPVVGSATTLSPPPVWSPRRQSGKLRLSSLPGGNEDPFHCISVRLGGGGEGRLGLPPPPRGNRHPSHFPLRWCQRGPSGESGLSPPVLRGDKMAPTVPVEATWTQ